jgi:hypothetical protein
MKRRVHSAVEGGFKKHRRPTSRPSPSVQQGNSVAATHRTHISPTTSTSQSLASTSGSCQPSATNKAVYQQVDPIPNDIPNNLYNYPIRELPGNIPDFPGNSNNVVPTGSDVEMIPSTKPQVATEPMQVNNQNPFFGYPIAALYGNGLTPAPAATSVMASSAPPPMPRRVTYEATFLVYKLSTERILKATTIIDPGIEYSVISHPFVTRLGADITMNPPNLPHDFHFSRPASDAKNYFTTVTIGEPSLGVSFVEQDIAVRQGLAYDLVIGARLVSQLMASNFNFDVNMRGLGIAPTETFIGHYSVSSLPPLSMEAVAESISGDNQLPTPAASYASCQNNVHQYFDAHN